MKTQIHSLLAFLLVMASACVCQRAHAQSAWSFATVPTSGVIVGDPGQTVGWGYTIVNSSLTDYLFITDLQTDNVFLHGAADTAPFDYPILAPMTSVTVPYGGGVGLAELTWDQNAPIGFQNSGSFIMSAVWYDGDPFNGGQYIANAGQNAAAYTATVIAAPVPEASSWQSMGVLLLLGSLLVVRRPRIKRN